MAEATTSSVLSQNNQFCATCKDGLITVTDHTTKEVRWTKRSGPIVAMAVSNDGKLLAYAGTHMTGAHLYIYQQGESWHQHFQPLTVNTVTLQWKESEGEFPPHGLTVQAGGKAFTLEPRKKGWST